MNVLGVRSFLALSALLFSLAGLFTGCGRSSGSAAAPAAGSESRFVFVSNTDDDSISVFTPGSNGVLTPVDTVSLATDSAPKAIVLHPGRAFLYVANSTVKFGDTFNIRNASIGAYTLADNGSIAEIAGSPFSLPADNVTGLTGGVFVSMAITPDGRFLYVGDVNNWQLLVFGVNQTTGALTLAFQTTLEDQEDFTGIEPWSVAVHPSGSFLFVGFYNSSDNTVPGGVRSFEIQADGSLTTEDALLYSVGGSYVSLAATPDGKFLYAAGTDRRAEFSVNTTTGALTLLVDPPADTSADQPKGVAIAPSGGYLYSANSLSGTVGALAVGSDGRTADSVAGQPFAVYQDNPVSITVTGDGLYLYVLNDGGPGGSNVTAYGITAGTGALEYIDAYPVGAGPTFLTALP
jgi:6-phosphogluconolactonase (cycloisomerase 2 family)